jgi:hypothetical protein
MKLSLAEEIAATAARLVVDEDLDYAQAKRKAARQLAGPVRQAELPSNEMVEDEVRTHLALFHADTQPAELRALRVLALRWMQRLADFRPHLAGAVWRGTATARSAVHIDLYCDDPKAAEIALINWGVDYDSAGGDGGNEPHCLSLAERCPGIAEPVTLHLLVRDLDDQRGALKPDARGRSWRGDTAALQRLLAADAA